MSGALYTITPKQAVRLFPDLPEELYVFLRYSTPLLAGYYNSSPACLAGLCPATLLSDTAYIWGWSTDIVEAHPIIYARWARRLVAKALTLYPYLVGHCYRHKWKWLRSLGAEITSVDGDLFTFHIKGF